MGALSPRERPCGRGAPAARRRSEVKFSNFGVKSSEISGNWLGPRTSCKKRSETERPFRSPQRLIYEVIELARSAYPPTQPAHINPASQTPSSMPSIVVLKNCSMPRNPKPTAKVPRCSARKGPLSNAPLLPPTCRRFADAAILATPPTPDFRVARTSFKEAQ